MLLKNSNYWGGNGKYFYSNNYYLIALLKDDCRLKGFLGDFMVYIGILWNIVNYLKVDIVSDINSYGEIVNSYELELGSQYDDFVRQIYEFDGIDDEKIKFNEIKKKMR